MRVIYFDIDSLRPDHLGCYGYHRPTSPNIDRLAAEGVRFDNCYLSDAPCLPNRTALWSGRFGIHTGVVDRHGRSDNWFLHINFWDPHQPYRTPAAYGEPVADHPTPAWLTEEIRREHWQRPGPQSAQDVTDQEFLRRMYREPLPRQPYCMSDLNEVRRMFDGYDTGVRYMDDHLGHILDVLAAQNGLDDTAIILSADHGENLGELNVYGGHRLADQFTSHIPLIVRWPHAAAENQGRVDSALHYQFDWAATLIELVGGQVPDLWDGQSFAGAFRNGTSAGRDWLVMSQAAIACQRAVRFRDQPGEYIAIRTYHDDYNGFPELMLFDLVHNPHELHDLAPRRPDLIERAQAILAAWHTEMMRTATHPHDPLLCGPANYRVPPRVPKPTSGLIEQQAWFMKWARPLCGGG